MRLLEKLWNYLWMFSNKQLLIVIGIATLLVVSCHLHNLNFVYTKNKQMLMRPKTNKQFTTFYDFSNLLLCTIKIIQNISFIFILFFLSFHNFHLISRNIFAFTARTRWIVNGTIQLNEWANNEATPQPIWADWWIWLLCLMLGCNR